MRRSSFAKLGLLAVLFAGMFAFTRHVQLKGGSLVARHEEAVRRQVVAHLAEQELARQGGPAARGHWLHTRGRKLVTDQGRRWRGTGVDLADGNQPLPHHAGFVRLSAAAFFAGDAASSPGELWSLAEAVDALSQSGQVYVLVGLPNNDSAWLWQAQMAALVHALASRPYVMFDLTYQASGSVSSEAGQSPEETTRQLRCIRQAEVEALAPAHIVAVDSQALEPRDAHHHRQELDYPRLTAILPSLEHNVVTLGRRPAYALRAANALFLEPLRPRLASVQPAT